MPVSSIKNALKPYVPERIIRYLGCINTLRRFVPCGFLKMACKSKVVFSRMAADPAEDYVRQVLVCFSKSRISSWRGYVYPYDPLVFREVRPGRMQVVSLTVDFGAVLDSDLREVRKRLEGCADKAFSRREIRLVEGMEGLASRCGESLRFPDMLYRKPLSLDEAVQKILFYDALFWQAGHRHIGLGRLDRILDPYYQADLAKGAITRDKAMDMIRTMCLVLSKDMAFKSVSLMGDTGQYILLGGVDKDGSMVQNDMTSIFLDVFRHYDRPDPKLILRAGDRTSAEVWKSAVECVCNGHGSPLIMNETLIAHSMEVFGYDKDDLWNLGTSACWEPLIIGRSFDQNNPFPPVVVPQSLDIVLHKDALPQNFEALLDACKAEIGRSIKDTVRDLAFDVSPLFSLFFEGCISREKDLTEGGAEYAYHGLQVVGLPNLVNALLAVKDLVFDRNEVSLEDCRAAVDAGFAGFEALREKIAAVGLKFGCPDGETVSLTCGLMDYIDHVVSGLTCNGRKLKVGFSSPSYVDAASGLGATMDGRKAGEPLAVHISPVSSDTGLFEILDFASQLRYGETGLNGNVVDFTIPASYIACKDKFVHILQDALDKGVFEIQLNVLDYETLVDAKAHPERHKDLIVRVWGFSAYFNDLPETYKDNLISRAVAYGKA